MNNTGNTILITGGATGIGGALAERFAGIGNKVVICGRREKVLLEFVEKFPSVTWQVCDLSKEEERVRLVEWVFANHPDVNILINNAGIQRRARLTDSNDWQSTHEEIRINLEAPIHLSQLFIPFLMKVQDSAIINVTSGLAFVPLAAVPVYSATKAAMHSFTLSMRHQLDSTPISVVEIIPPAVNTDLGGPGLHTFGVPLDQFADAVFEKLKSGSVEIGYGDAEHSRTASRAELDSIFLKMNNQRRS